jgi:hypothetical protein
MARRQAVISISGRVWRDGETLVCECKEIGQTTWGRSLEDIIQDTGRASRRTSSFKPTRRED